MCLKNQLWLILVQKCLAKYYEASSYVRTKKNLTKYREVTDSNVAKVFLRGEVLRVNNAGFHLSSKLLQGFLGGHLGRARALVYLRLEREGLASCAELSARG